MPVFENERGTYIFNSKDLCMIGHMDDILTCGIDSLKIEGRMKTALYVVTVARTYRKAIDDYKMCIRDSTNIADRKSRQMLHKAKKMNPDAIVVATGCYAQTDTEKLKEDASVDLILGNNQKNRIVEALEEYEKEHEKKTRVIEINRTKEYEKLCIDHTAEHVRAYIKVQDGCNQFCTYCIIPLSLIHI